MRQAQRGSNRTTADESITGCCVAAGRPRPGPRGGSHIDEAGRPPGDQKSRRVRVVARDLDCPDAIVVPAACVGPLEKVFGHRVGRRPRPAERGKREPPETASTRARQDNINIGDEDVTLTDVVVSGCTSNQQGGGIAVNKGGRLTMTNCTVSGNSAISWRSWADNGLSRSSRCSSLEYGLPISISANPKCNTGNSLFTCGTPKTHEGSFRQKRQCRPFDIAMAARPCGNKPECC